MKSSNEYEYLSKDGTYKKVFSPDNPLEVPRFEKSLVTLILDNNTTTHRSILARTYYCAASVDYIKNFISNNFSQSLDDNTYTANTLYQTVLLILKKSQEYTQQALFISSGKTGTGAVLTIDGLVANLATNLIVKTYTRSTKEILATMNVSTSVTSPDIKNLTINLTDAIAGSDTEKRYQIIGPSQQSGSLVSNDRLGTAGSYLDLNTAADVSYNKSLEELFISHTSGFTYNIRAVLFTDLTKE